VAFDLAPPIIGQHAMPKGLRMQRIDLVIGEAATPFGDQFNVPVCLRGNSFHARLDRAIHNCHPRRTSTAQQAM
jgi:hypothetical protein